MQRFGLILFILFCQNLMAQSFLEFCEDPKNQKEMDLLRASFNYPGNRTASCSSLERSRKNMTELKFSNGIPKSKSFLDFFPNVIEINLLNFDESYIPNLKNINQIQELEIYSSKPKPLKINFLNDFKQLKVLRIQFSIEKNQDLTQLISLRELNLSPTIVEHFSLQDIQLPKGLTYLSVTNSLSTLEGIEQLENLETFHHPASYLIKDYSPLGNLKKLKTLILRSNQISDPSFLKKLKNLEYLDLDESQIEDFSFIKGLKKIKYLSLKRRERVSNEKTIVTNLNFFPRVCKLEYLDLSYHDIKNPNPFKRMWKSENGNFRWK